MISRALRNPLLAIGAVALLSACAWNRTVVNKGVEKLDASPIVAGQSTRVDVIKQLGVPPVKSGEAASLRAISATQLKYSTFERRCFRVGFEEFWIITPFRWCFADYPYELSVEFDEDGVVSGVYATRRDMIWPPFESEKHRPPPSTVELSGSLLQ